MNASNSRIQEYLRVIFTLEDNKEIYLSQAQP